jgi:ubiquinone/menaquinone biosynthesis C-methylase UbiE
MVEPGVIPSRNPFALPRGALGRFAGWVMGHEDRQHRELAGLLAPSPGTDVCEIGFGPGQLLASLAVGDPTIRLCGVDPSAVMLGQARQRLARTGVSADLRLGVAGAVPFDDESVDHVVAVNSAAIWPDLPAALADARRVLRPGGTLLLAWHSATSPRRLQRSLARPDTWWTTLIDTVRTEFGQARRHDLRYSTVCTATAPPSPTG